MSRDDAVLLDMLRAAHLVVEFRAGLDKVTFLDDLKTQSSIQHRSQQEEWSGEVTVDPTATERVCQTRKTHHRERDGPHDRNRLPVSELARDHDGEERQAVEQ